jgi:hypothetical protein
MTIKIIRLTRCKDCPHFREIPPNFYDGMCNHKDAAKKSKDVGIANNTSIPYWCSLE